MMKAGAALAAAAAVAGAAAGSDPTPLLLRSLFRYRIVSQALAEAGRLSAGQDADAASQIAAAARSWKSEQMAAVRADLAGAAGEGAADLFRGFVEQFSQAEQAASADYLAVLSNRMGWRPAPATYADMSRLVLDTLLADDVAAAGRFLGEIETWLDVRRRPPTHLPCPTG